MARRDSVRTSAGVRESGSPGRGLRNAVLALTLAIVVGAVICSVGFVMYTAWLHDLKRGVFALVFAVMSAKIGLNWFIWRDEDVSLHSPSEVRPPHGTSGSPGSPF